MSRSRQLPDQPVSRTLGCTVRVAVSDAVQSVVPKAVETGVWRSVHVAVAMYVGMLLNMNEALPQIVGRDRW